MKKIMFSAIALLSFATYAQEETTSTEAAVYLDRHPCRKNMDTCRYYLPIVQPSSFQP